MEKFDIPMFKFKHLPFNEVRNEWARYKRHFEFLALANGITNKTKLKNILLARAGPEVQDIFCSIPGANVEERIGVDPYKIAIEKLDEYFAPKQHETYQRYTFWTLKPNDSEESLDKFLLRVMELSSKCQFGRTEKESREISVVDKIVQLAPPELREKFIQKENLSLDDVIRMVNSHCSVKYQVGQMEPCSSKHSTGLAEVNRVRDSRKIECFRCGGQDGHLANDPDCPAIAKKCDRCGRKGHYASKCNTVQNRNRWNVNRGRAELKGNQRKRFKNEYVRMIDSTGDEGKYDTNQNTCFVFSIGEGEEFVWLIVGGVLTQFLIDSGCEKNILDDRTWRNMIKQGASFENSRSFCNQTFKAYGQNSESLQVMQVFEANLVLNNHLKSVNTRATFYVIKNGTQPLLGRTTAKELGVLFLGLPSSQSVDIQRMYTEQKHSFPKIKGIKLKIPVDESVTPVIQHARRPPLALLNRIEEKLQSLLSSDIIESVNEFSPWVSPLVTIVKDNGDLRLCVDMRRANVAIKRETHLMPTFEDILPRLKTAKVFSRLDIKDAFHQVELHESSRQITTFITHKGTFRYKRLMFGISCAPEMFQKILEQLLSRCQHVVNYIDDILVYGSNEEEHDRELKIVMDIFKNHDILLNQKKCIFKV
ncbi:uncharacterized protein K02A2.6-like [Uranotaenia lowii]|uniref:uncharacterized protein K02A2.6-like n=1 Tax=Uranotaenia lowii TaxID=190385 RepID=UPI00247A3812|nr:uncharacterized protein K02A2.6-like [Uranotaenia lowii]